MPSSDDLDRGRAVVADDYAANELSADAFLGEQRWGACKITLTVEQVEALRAGRTLAVDILNEYVAFLSIETAQRGTQ